MLIKGEIGVTKIPILVKFAKYNCNTMSFIISCLSL